MPEFLRYNPATGIKYYTEFDESESRMHVHAVSDVEPVIELCKKLKNEGIKDRGLKGDFFHWAKIPPILQVILLKRGLNIYSPDESESKKIRYIINTEFPAFKTTYKTHI